MCGIYASIACHGYHRPSDHLKSQLRCRGPDYAGGATAEAHLDDGGCAYLSFYSTVLALRGGHVFPQPLVDPATGSILCWNGEAWRINGAAVDGNDGEAIIRLLAAACSQASRTHAISQTIEVLRSIAGPFAFVFFDKVHSLVYYGRDCLGRRSLLYNIKKDSITSAIEFSSISDNSKAQWQEVEADGIYMLPCALPHDDFISPNDSIVEKDLPIQTTRFQWSNNQIEIEHPLGLLNRDTPNAQHQLLNGSSLSVKFLEQQLLDSLRPRVLDIPAPGNAVPLDDVRLAVLFSGGLDCTLLARMAHDLLPGEQAIDLLNVAFENPRVVEAAKKSQKNPSQQFSPYEICPDRITGRRAWEELRHTCPGRKWRFIQVNIPYAETVDHRDRVISLMYPHNTEMDLSIACALYFAARGSGLASTNSIDQPVSYTTQARVLLSGLGADELFGGYSRHGAAFSRNGYVGLLDELQLDVDRLGKRNLGRDDRVISTWGREARFPYLDEAFVRWVLERPILEKCGFGTELKVEGLPDAAEGEIEPGKKALRLLAWNLGMHSVAHEKKRAIQFGARTAKMETGRTKGTTLIT